jgi:hypothetical protein
LELVVEEPHISKPMAYRLSVRASTSGVQAVFFWGIHMSEQELYKRAHEFFNLVDGKLIWKIDRKRCKIGMRAGCVNPGNFYRQVYIDNKKYMEHRIIFLMHYGYFPPMIDHINQIKDDNRIENLRAADKHTNQYNSPAKSWGCGLKGVTFDKSRNKWIANIRTKDNRKFLGRFKTPEEAHEVYKKAALDLHGEFARF